jgi:hypothetical protein
MRFLGQIVPCIPDHFIAVIYATRFRARKELGLSDRIHVGGHVPVILSGGQLDAFAKVVLVHRYEAYEILDRFGGSNLLFGSHSCIS